MSNLLDSAFPGGEHVSRRVEFLEAFEGALASQSRKSKVEEGSPIRITLLGRCSISGVENVVDERSWKTQKSMLLFAFLASRVNRPVPDSLLTGTFWPDSDEERARSSLRNALHQIRTALAPVTGGSEIVERNRRSRTVTLTMPCVLDTDLFEASVREATELYAQDRPGDALEQLRSAMPLCGGEFLEGFLDEWVLSLREHYNELHLRALHLLARCHLAMGDAAAAEQVARFAVTLDNYREDLHADLIQALTAQERRGEALRHYREMVDTFETEMGVVPSSLHDIYDALLAEGPERMSSALQGTGAWSRTSDRSRTVAGRTSARRAVVQRVAS